MNKEILGNITLYNCDCMDYMSTCKDNEFDLAIVDPPFFSGPEKRKYYGNAISKHGVKRIEYKPLIESWIIPDNRYYDELVRISKNQIIFGINYFEFINRTGPGRIIWDKINDGSTFSNCEIASCSIEKLKVKIYRYLWRGMMQGSKSDGSKMNGNKKTNEKKIHPTQKPVKLYEWLLHNYAKPGQKIFDSHFGSLSIGIACHNLGFELTACELDKDYYEAAKKRLQVHQMQKTIFDYIK